MEASPHPIQRPVSRGIVSPRSFNLIPTGGSPGVQAGQTILLSTMLIIGHAQPLSKGRTANSCCVCDKANGGARRDRTDDLLNANQALSQLSYGPSFVSEITVSHPGRTGGEDHGERFRRPVGGAAQVIGADFRAVMTEAVRSVRHNMVGTGGLEPPTSRLSGVCSNHLSYVPLTHPGPPLLEEPRTRRITTSSSDEQGRSGSKELIAPFFERWPAPDAKPSIQKDRPATASCLSQWKEKRRRRRLPCHLYIRPM